MRQTLGSHVCDLTRAVALKKVAESVQVYLAIEHDEHHALTMIERAVGEWLVSEVESLLADGTELLTVPRYGHAHRLRERLYELREREHVTAMGDGLRQAA